jgi:hypothetical protein
MLPIYAHNYTGSAEDIEAIQQFARDYDWAGRIVDPEFAADVALGTLAVGADDFNATLHTEAVVKLFAALVDSAAKAK